MKHFITATVVAAALTAPAFAAGHAQVQADIDAMGITADVSQLSTSELARLEVVLNGGFDSPAAKKGRIETLLEGADAMTMEQGDDGRVAVTFSMNSLRTQVDNSLSTSGVECDVYALPDEKVTELYFAINSSMTTGEAIESAKAACL